jgi:hypothetical protein
MVADLQSGLGAHRVSRNQTWIRPGYKPPEKSIPKQSLQDLGEDTRFGDFSFIQRFLVSYGLFVVVVVAVPNHQPRVRYHFLIAYRWTKNRRMECA